MIIEDIRNFIENWNLNYPIDIWWRNKYNVPFGSKKHRAANFIDMMIEWEEEKMFQEIAEEQKKKKDKDLNLDDLQKFSTEKNDEFTKVVQMTEKEIDDEFDNLSLADFNT